MQEVREGGREGRRYTGEVHGEGAAVKELMVQVECAELHTKSRMRTREL